MNCRHCRTSLVHVFLDLGFAPPSNSYLTRDDLVKPEKYYPLKTWVCENCWLVQTEDYAQADELFTSEYAYFSSTSSSWLAHAKQYARKMTETLRLGAGSFVIEVASNDGYLLKNFVQAGIACLGIEPTASTAAAAERLGIPVLRQFFGSELAAELAQQAKQADLITGNNVYAHVPDINDFTRGLKQILKPQGVVTLEFPHLLKLLSFAQFDTVYHEHFSYLSLHTVKKIFHAAGLRVWHVDELPTHGGSLRVYGCHSGAAHIETAAVNHVLTQEAEAGMQTLAPYQQFQPRANRVKNDLLQFLIAQAQQGKKVAAYGAAAKGNTLLNYGGVKPDLMPFVCDAAPAKQYKYMPGSHIPILPPSALSERSIDFVVILPWNIAAEVRQQYAWLRERGTRFVTAVPALTIH